MTNENLVRTIEITDEDGNVSTREIITYAGLLSKAHEQGLERIETKIVELPTEENGMTAICTATVTTAKGVFSDCGDACPGNVRATAVPHLIRVALTRAKARALKDAVNIGAISLEEFGDLSPEAAQSGAANLPLGNPDHAKSGTDDRKITDPQRKRLLDLAKQPGRSDEAAEAYLCEQLGVDSLAEVTLVAASALIAKLTAGESLKHPAKAERSKAR